MSDDYRIALNIIDEVAQLVVGGLLSLARAHKIALDMASVLVQAKVREIETDREPIETSEASESA